MTGQGRPDVRGRRLSLLHVDPDLAAGIPPAQVAIAQARLHVRGIAVDRGAWSDPDEHGSDGLGLVVVRGILQRTLAVADLPCTELLGAGDLVRPVATVDDAERIRGRPAWSAVAPVELGVLDDAFVQACAPWPSVVTAIVARVIERGHWRASIRSAIAQTRRIDNRLLLLLWHFSQRWGTVRGDGVCLELAVTHETLARLVGATRSAVTTALSHLERRGLLARPAEGAWLLRGHAPPFAAPA